jgi:hypothetical protein
MKRQIKICLGLILAAAMFLAIIPGMRVLQVQAKEKPASNGYINMIDSKSNFYRIIDCTGKYKSQKVKGVSYNKKTNTLTLNGVNKPDYKFVMQDMGDITITLKGTNKIRAIDCGYYSINKKNTLTINGKGKLVCNSKKSGQQREGYISVSSTNGKLTIAKTVKMDIKTRSGYSPITIYRRLASQSEKKSKYYSISGSFKWNTMYGEYRWNKTSFTKSGK